MFQQKPRKDKLNIGSKEDLSHYLKPTVGSPTSFERKRGGEGW